MKFHFKQVMRLMMITLVSSLTLAACGKGCMKKEAVKAESLQLIPADSNMLIGINWKKAEASPLGAKLTEGMPPEARPLLQGIESVVIGANINSALPTLATAAPRDPQEMVAVLSGKVDQTTLLKQISSEAAKTGATLQEEEYEGVKMHLIPNAKGFTIAFIEEQVVLGTKESVKKVIDLSKGKGDSIEKNQAVMDIANNLDRSKMLWAVALIPAGTIPAGAEGGAANPMNALSSIKSLDLALDYNENLIIDLGIFTATKEDAQQMMTMANSYKTLFGGSLAGKSPELGKVLGGLSIDAKENKVVLTLKLDQATVEELAKKAKSQAPGKIPGENIPPAPMPPETAPTAP